MGEVKRIELLTSGGNCARLNAVIRAVVFRATHYDRKVLGIDAMSCVHAHQEQRLGLDNTQQMFSFRMQFNAIVWLIQKVHW